MRVLVTGAGGFIGRRVVAALQRRGVDVVGAVRSGGLGAVPSVAGDLTQPGVVARMVADVQATVVVHLAWVATPGVYQHSERNLAHLRAGLELVEAAVDSGVQHVVFAGSCLELAPCEGAAPESWPVNPQTLYTSTKWALWTVARQRLADTGVGATWGRVFYPYGPGSPRGKLFPAVRRAVGAGEPFRMRSDGSHVRDFVHVDDVAEAFAVLACGQGAGVVHIGRGRGVRLRDAVVAVAAEVGDPGLVSFSGEPLPEPPVVLADVGYLRSLGWRPAHTLGRPTEGAQP